jgi:hypothetical protein
MVITHCNDNATKQIEEHVQALLALGWRWRGNGLYPSWGAASTPAQPMRKHHPVKDQSSESV